MNKQISLIILIIVLELIDLSLQLQIPLTYAFSSDMLNKYAIQLSFTTSQTITPYAMDTLYLYNANISLNTIMNTNPSSQQKVTIGLLHPSQFLQAVSSHFKIPLNQIQINKQDYLKLILNDLSFIQSQDIFTNLQYYNIKVQYNYGQQILIQHEQIQLTDGDNIVWNQFLIRKIVNNIKQENNIQVKFNNNNDTININGLLQNFPRITIVSGTYLFKVDMEKLLKKKPQLMYVNSNTNTYNNINTNTNTNGNPNPYSNPNPQNPKPTKQPTKIGLQLLTQFSKFQIQQQKIIFKRTSQLFMLYLFLTYFVIICLLIIIKNRQDNFKTTMFVKSIIKWITWEDYNSRIQVLRTQLE